MEPTYDTREDARAALAARNATPQLQRPMCPLLRGWCVDTCVCYAPARVVCHHGSGRDVGVVTFTLAAGYCNNPMLVGFP